MGVAGGINLYRFNGNNPAAFADPFGLCGAKQANDTIDVPNVRVLCPDGTIEERTIEATTVSQTQLDAVRDILSELSGRNLEYASLHEVRQAISMVIESGEVFVLDRFQADNAEVVPLGFSYP